MTDQAFSGTSTLGTPTQRYEAGSGAGNVILALVLGGMGVFFAVGAFADTSSRSSSDSSMIMFGLLAFFFIGFAVFTLVKWWGNRGVYVQAYSGGVARIKGTKTEEFRWDDVRAVWQSVTKHYRNGIYTGTTYLYTVQTADNRMLKFSNEIKGIEQLGQLIQNESTKRLFPKMVAAYNAGQTVPFGQFTLSKEGVGHKNKYLTWAEIEGTQVNNGYVTFKKQGKWFNWANVPVASIPNLIVFLSLIDHVVGLKRGR
ncbi:MAG: DUF6585 family protein [Anaerolineae bacterium]